MSEKQEFVNGLLVRLSKTQKTITPEKHLVDDLGFDSLTFMELIACVEDEYDACIPVSRLSSIMTVAELYQAIENIDEYMFQEIV